MLNDRPVVLVDSDDVLGRLTKRMCEEAKRHTGREYLEEHIKEWDFFTEVCANHPEIPNLKKLIEDAMGDVGFAGSLEPFPGAVEGIQKLREVAEVFCVTSPWSGPFWEAERRWWLKHHFDFPSKRVLQGHSKFLVHAEVFVDDKPENVAQWQAYQNANSRNPGFGLLWDRPHNQGDIRIVARAQSWDDVIRLANIAGAIQR